MKPRLTIEDLAQLVPSLREAGMNRLLSDFCDDSDNLDETRYELEVERLCTSERRIKRTRKEGAK